MRRRILRGDVYVRTVQVPEGYNIYDIAAVVEQAGLGPAADFVAAAKGDVSLIKDLDPKAHRWKAICSPTPTTSRALIPHTTSPPLWCTAFARRRRRSACCAAGHPSHCYDRIDRGKGDCRSGRAARWSPACTTTGWPEHAAGADPSVVYAALLAGRYRGTIYQSDLQFDSPYNTYKFAGLPPGPIANPGAASLEAAMHPAQTDYLYFVSDNNGHHRFSRTAAEHERNVAAYREPSRAH